MARYLTPNLLGLDAENIHNKHLRKHIDVAENDYYLNNTANMINNNNNNTDKTMKEETFGRKKKKTIFHQKGCSGTCVCSSG